LDDAAKMFTPNPSNALVYIYGKHAPIALHNIAVVIDTQVVGHLGNGRYLLVELPPGEYVFTSVGGQRNPEFNLRVAAGEIRFLEQSQLWGFNELGGAGYTEVNRAKGKKVVLARKRVPARYATPQPR
jgi:hypothetical protein